MNLRLLSICLVFWGGNAFAFCFEEAGASYDINPDLLKAVSWIESRWQPSAININNFNGSIDLGLMQINSFWKNKLDEETWGHIVIDNCANVIFGAWVLNSCLERYGNTWNGVGCYNSQKIEKRKKYAWLVYNAYQAIVNGVIPDEIGGNKEPGHRAGR